MEVIPYTLAENAGLNPIATVTELRNRHAQCEKRSNHQHPGRECSPATSRLHKLHYPCLRSNAVTSLLAAHDVHYVVNLEDASDSLGGKGNGACGDEKWLDYIFFQDVGDCSFSHIDPCCFLSLGMPIPQFCHSGYGREN